MTPEQAKQLHPPEHVVLAVKEKHLAGKPGEEFEFRTVSISQAPNGQYEIALCKRYGICHDDGLEHRQHLTRFCRYDTLQGLLWEAKRMMASDYSPFRPMTDWLDLIRPTIADAQEAADITGQFCKQFERIFGGTARPTQDLVYACGRGWPRRICYKPTKQAVAVMQLMDALRSDASPWEHAELREQVANLVAEVGPEVLLG